MGKYFAIFLLLVVASSCLADRLVRLYDVSRGSVVNLIKDGYDVANVDIRGGYVDIMLPENAVDQAALLSYDYDVLPREWGELLPENSRNAGYYYDPDENWTFWSSLSVNYPNLANPPVTIGHSYQNRDIYMVQLTSQASGSKPAIYFSSLIHAREPGANSVLIDFAMWLTSNYDGGDTRAAYILDHSTVYFVPIANPDGYADNMPNGGNRRKNMNFSAGGDGVDLNRNWGYKWHYDDIGSSGDPSSQTYRGTAPFSEPETRAQRDFIMSIKPVGAMNYHTYGGDLLYPYGYQFGLLAPDNEIFVGWADAMTAVNQYHPGTAWQIMYTVNGEQDDWCYSGDSLPKVFAMTPEVADSGFWKSQNDTTEIVRICNECRPMNILFCFAVLEQVGISAEEATEIGQAISLNGVYPNPVASSASFSITISAVSGVDLDIYDISGRIVHSFTTAELAAGTGSVIWVVPDDIPAGMYTARVSDAAGNFDYQRFTVIK